MLGDITLGLINSDPYSDSFISLFTELHLLYINIFNMISILFLYNVSLSARALHFYKEGKIHEIDFYILPNKCYNKVQINRVWFTI